jgi:hypothetical protein
MFVPKIWSTLNSAAGTIETALALAGFSFGRSLLRGTGLCDRGFSCFDEYKDRIAFLQFHSFHGGRGDETGRIGVSSAVAVGDGALPRLGKASLPWLASKKSAAANPDAVAPAGIEIWRLPWRATATRPC